jgi:hypothetical protein
LRLCAWLVAVFISDLLRKTLCCAGDGVMEAADRRTTSFELDVGATGRHATVFHRRRRVRFEFRSWQNVFGFTICFCTALLGLQLVGRPLATRCTGLPLLCGYNGCMNGVQFFGIILVIVFLPLSVLPAGGWAQVRRCARRAPLLRHRPSGPMRLSRPFRCAAVLCCAVLCCAVLCRAVPCCASPGSFGALLCCVVRCAALCCSVCCAVLRCAALCCAVLRCAALCCAVLRCAALCCTVLHWMRCEVLRSVVNCSRPSSA